MPSPVKYLSADQRRAATVDAVIELAAERNPADITTAAIAEKMGVTQGALFRHFPDKSAIFALVVNWVADRLPAFVDQAVEDEASAMAALERAFLAHAKFVSIHPGVPRIILTELQRAEETAAKRVLRSFLQRYQQRIVRLIEQGKAQGDIDTQIDAREAAILFLGMIQGLVVQSLAAGDPDLVHREAPRLFVLFRRGLRSSA